MLRVEARREPGGPRVGQGESIWVGAPVSKSEREGGGRGPRKRAGPQVGLGFAEAMGHWPGTCRSLVSTGWVLRSLPSPRAASCVLPAQQAGSGCHRVSSFL